MIEERERRASVAMPALMRKVYVWMTLALVITGMTAYGVASSPGILTVLFSSRWMFIGIFVAELAVVWTVSARINRMSITSATLLFVLYSVLNGLTLSFIFLVYTATSITNVFLITAATFAAMALVGLFTKADLTSLGKILFMALIGLVIATVVNMFLKSGTFHYVLSYIGVAIFVGLTAYDTQKIRNMLVMADGSAEVGQKIALLGALTLYLDFLNLFLYLLRIFGSSRN